MGTHNFIANKINRVITLLTFIKYKCILNNILKNNKFKKRTYLWSLSLLFFSFILINNSFSLDPGSHINHHNPLNLNPNFLAEKDSLDIVQDDISFSEFTPLHGEKILTVGWDPWYPYEYLKIKELPSTLTGIEIELLKLFAQHAGYRLKFVSQPWHKTLEDIKEGKIDLSIGATYSKERAQFAYFSKSYRDEEDSLYILKSKNKQYPFKTIDEFVEYIKHHPFKLGVIKGNIYPNSTLNQFIKENEKSLSLIQSETDVQNAELLLDDEIDGFIGDRISASTAIWETGRMDEVVERYFNLKTPIHYIFSKKSVTEKVVNDFNKVIDKIKGDAVYRNIFSWYLYPVIMVQTTEAPWFKLLDVFGTLFFSISGALIAYTLNNTLLAAIIYGFLPSMAGAILRDVIVKHKPIEVMSTPLYMLLVISTVIFVFVLVNLYDRIIRYRYSYRYHDEEKSNVLINKIITKLKFHLEHVLAISDAFGLSALSVFGVLTALVAKADPLWLYGPFFAFLSGAFGTVFRDILSKREHLEIVIGEIYSEISIVWGLIFSIALLHTVGSISPELVRGLIIMTVVGVFVTRLIVYYFKVPNVHFR